MAGYYNERLGWLNGVTDGEVNVIDNRIDVIYNNIKFGDKVVVIGDGTDNSKLVVDTDKFVACPRYLILNNCNEDAESDGGLVVNVSVNSLYTDMNVTGSGFVAATDMDNPYVQVDAFNAILPGAFVFVSGSDNNNGVYEVLALTGAESPYTLTILGNGAFSASQPYSGNDFIAEIPNGQKIRVCSISVIRGTHEDDSVEIAKGSTNNLNYHKVLYDEKSSDSTLGKLTLSPNSNQLVLSKTTLSAAGTTERTHTIKDTANDEFTMNIATQTLKNKSLEDTTTYFINNSDNSKKAQFSLSPIGASTTRTFSLFDQSDTLVGTSYQQNIQNKNLYPNVYFTDSSDNTKKLGFDLSSQTASTTTTISNFNNTSVSLELPLITSGSSDVIVARETSDTLKNKTITDNNNTIAATSFQTSINGSTVNVKQTAPAIGQMLRATSTSDASWATPFTVTTGSGLTGGTGGGSSNTNITIAKATDQDDVDKTQTTTGDPSNPAPNGANDTLTIDVNGTITTKVTASISGTLSVAVAVAIAAAIGIGAFGGFAGAGGGAFGAGSGVGLGSGGIILGNGSKLYSKDWNPYSFTYIDNSSPYPALVCTSTVSNGDLLIGSTSSGPIKNKLTGTTNQVNVTNGSGTITLSLPQSIATTSNVTFNNVTANGTLATNTVQSTSGTTGNITVNSNMIVNGNVDIVGTISTLNSTNVNIKDQYLGLNLYNTSSTSEGGICLPTTCGSPITLTGNFVIGVASTSNPTVQMTTNPGWTAGTFIMISGSTGNFNDGIYEVNSITGSSNPYTLTVRGIGTVAVTEKLSQNQFTAAAVPASCFAYAVQVSCIRSTNTAWQIAIGTSAALTWHTIMDTDSAQTLTNKTLVDASTYIVDDGDNSKKLQFQCSGISTATTRTLTVPNASTTIVGTDVSQILTNKTLIDNSTFVADNSDNTKLLKFDVAGTTGTTQTLTTAQTANRNHTIPDSGADSSFIMSNGAQTVNGVKTFSSGVVISATTNQLVLGTTNTTTITVPAPSSSRVITINDPGASAYIPTSTNTGTNNYVLVATGANTANWAAISSSLLPNSGVTAGTYNFPVSISVNAQGLITAATNNQNLIPNADNTSDLGSATNRWRNTYSQNVLVGSNPSSTAQSARLLIRGTDADTTGSVGPNAVFMTASDQYPLLQILPYSHDNIQLSFDAYYGTDGNFRSGMTGAGIHRIRKNSGALNFDYGIAGTAGTTVSFATLPAIQILSNGTSIIEKLLVTGTDPYNTGTASQSGTTVTGSGTTFTRQMIGGLIVWNNGSHAYITGYTSATSLSTNVSQTISTSSYNIYYNTLISSRGNLSSSGLIVRSKSVTSGMIAPTTVNLIGTDNNQTTGATIQSYTGTDDYPLLQLLSHQHDNIGLNFDSYWNQGNTRWESSNGTANYQIYKQSGNLNFNYASGVSQGSSITFATAMKIATTGMKTISWKSSGNTASIDFSNVGYDGQVFSMPSETYVTDTYMCVTLGTQVNVTSSAAIAHSFRATFTKYNTTVKVTLIDLTGASSLTSTDVVLLSGVVPSGLRPATEQYLACASLYNAYYYSSIMRVRTNGDIQIAPSIGAGNSWVSGNSWAFLATTVSYLL